MIVQIATENYREGGFDMYHTNLQFDGGAPVMLMIWFIFTIGVIVGWVIFLVAVWRGMKAHESIAESMKQIADKKNQ
jgi:hypothetical protein